ncbi:MAG: hypothetical protein SOW55_07120 [Bacilli bacterium]|nr:hypothetical protein [Bacillales bacterium]MDY2575717.1 hypothetical protein [Bacilli bacterium]
MKKNLEILLIALCLITNYFIKNYLSFIALFFLIILYLFDENRENFKKVLIKLEVINQIYISKEEKLNNVLGQSNLPFQQRCKIIAQNAKLKIEKEFYSELSLCNNKTNIDNLIIQYKEILNKNQKGLIMDYFIFSFFLLVMINLFPSFSYSSSLKIISFLPSLFLLFDYIMNTRRKAPIFASKFNKMYIEFYSSLSYLRPMECLIKTVDKYPSKHNPFALLLDDINSNKMSLDNKIYEKYEVFTQIYKICYSNKFTKDLFLEEYYRQCINKSSTFFLFIKDNIINANLIITIILGVFL